MTRTDQEALIEFGRDIGQSVFPETLNGRFAVQIGALVTADVNRAYMALRSLEQGGHES